MLVTRLTIHERLSKPNDGIFKIGTIDVIKLVIKQICPNLFKRNPIRLIMAEFDGLAFKP